MKTDKNISSGAEKVETLEKEQWEGADPQPTSAPKTKKAGTMSANGPQKAKKATASAAVKREKAAADKRVENGRANRREKDAEAQKRRSEKEAKIEKRAAVKQKKLEKKQAIAEKKLARKEMIARKKAERLEKKAERQASLKSRRLEKKAERTARRELLKNESKTERARRQEREKRERLALRQKKQADHAKARDDKASRREAARVRKAEDKKHRREQKTERRRTAGWGGWLAAVISLGTACLILAAVVTAGAFRMNDMATAAEGDFRATLYEMVSVSEDLDDNLGKLRISSGLNEQRELLTGILVDSAILECAVEKMPVDAATGAGISSFVNETSRYAKGLLARVNGGQPLTEKEREGVTSLYKKNDEVYKTLNTLVTKLTAGELRDFLSGGGSMMEKVTDLAEGMEEAIADAPFLEEGNVGENRLSLLEEISASEAELMAKEYFRGYHVRDIRYTGETMSGLFSAYNFVLTDENGIEIFAEISKRGGKLVFFNTYEECEEKNFSLEECDALARSFLKEIGIDNAEAVWLSDGGMVANLTYTTVEDGARIYSEIIRVRVCEQKGRVVGMDARSYALNHAGHNTEHKLGREEAQRYLSAELEPYSCNLAVIPLNGREVTAYEFACRYLDDEYLVYLDADTGEELRIYRVVESAQGSYLR